MGYGLIWHTVLQCRYSTNLQLQNRDLLKTRLKIWLLDRMSVNIKRRKIPFPFKTMCFYSFSEEHTAVWLCYCFAWWELNCLSDLVGPGQTLLLTLVFTVSFLNSFYELFYCVCNNTLLCLRDSRSLSFFCLSLLLMQEMLIVKDMQPFPSSLWLNKM